MVWGDLFGRREAREEPAERIDLPTPPSRDDLGASLDRVEAMVAAGAVPSCVTARVERVTHVVRDTIPRLDAVRGSAHGYWVMATATDYLPEAVDGYLRLPRRFADSRPIDEGRTSLMVLVDQLDLLGATMDEVFDAVCRDDAVALVAHGRFLAEKFGHAPGGDLAVDLPVPPPPADARPSEPADAQPYEPSTPAAPPASAALADADGPTASGGSGSSPVDSAVSWVYLPGTPQEVFAENTHEVTAAHEVTPGGQGPDSDPTPDAEASEVGPAQVRRLEPPGRGSMLDLDDLPGGGAR